MSKRFNISLFLITLLFWSSPLLAQAPESMNYQAVIRDGSGELVTSQQVGLRIKILQGSASGSSVYEETYLPTTNAYGLVNLQLGTGTVQSGTFSSIDWGNGPYFVETAADVSGGTSYLTISTTQFMSVPYALYANVADSLVGYDPSPENELPSGSIVISEQANDTALINRGFSITGMSEQTIIPISGSSQDNADSSAFYSWHIMGLSDTVDRYNTSYNPSEPSSNFIFQDKIYIVHHQTGEIMTVNLSNGNFSNLSISPPNFSCGLAEYCTHKSSLWTGNDLYLYGGIDNPNSDYINELWKYSPTNNSWSEINLPNDFPYRGGCEMHWSGSEIIFSGGFIDPSDPNPFQYFIEKYNPSNNSWSTTNTTNAPQNRYYHASIYANNKLFVWGGNDMSSNQLSDGAIYDFSTNSWSTLPTSPISARSEVISFWSGSEFMVLGGGANDQGASYNPSNNSWNLIEDIPFSNIKTENYVFDGEKLIAGVHEYVNGVRRSNTYIYFPDNNDWVSITGFTQPIQESQRHIQCEMMSNSNTVSYSLGWLNSNLNSNFNSTDNQILLYSLNEQYLTGTSQIQNQQTKWLYYYKKN